MNDRKALELPVVSGNPLEDGTILRLDQLGLLVQFLSGH